MHFARLGALVSIAVLACGPSVATVNVSQPQGAPVSTSQPVVAPHFPPDWPYASGAPAPHSSKGMVSSDCAIATKVGVDVLASGGNAVDAAVATAFALAVAFPTRRQHRRRRLHWSRASRQALALDFRETAPAAATRDMYLGPDGKSTADCWTGWRSVGAPGSVAGLWEAWHRSARRRSRGPSCSRRPSPRRPRLRRRRRVRRERSGDAEAPRQVPRVGGALPAERRASAGRLHVAESGPRRGPPAHRRGGPAGLLRGPRRRGARRGDEGGRGPRHRRGPRRVHGQWRAPIEFTTAGRHVVGMPPPSSGGSRWR